MDNGAGAERRRMMVEEDAARYSPSDAHSGQRFRSYRDLHVWVRGMDLAEACYMLTKGFPREETYGMTSQIRRSSVSVPANIAEGRGRESPKEFVRFLRISQGSLKEAETHLMLASRVGLATKEEMEPLLAQCEEVGKMLRALIRAIQRKVSE